MAKNRHATYDREYIENRSIPEPNSGCWLWMGCVHKDGYAKISSGQNAHRVSYSLFVCEAPKGMDIDHKCKNRSCVNPDHLEAVTHKENVRRRDLNRTRDALGRFA